MWRWIANQVSRRAVAFMLVAATLLFGVVAASFAPRVGRDDNLLAFLPPNNPAIKEFQEINARFGGLDVAIVGIEVDNPFAATFLERLKRVTRKLNDERSIALALSLGNVDDFAPDKIKGGIQIDYLVNRMPTGKAEEAKLRARVMSRAHVVGRLISPDADAVVLYVFAAPDADRRALADLVRRYVTDEMKGETVHWGGVPFISTYIYDLTQADMKRLIPWAILIIIFIVVVSIRHWLGVLLALLTPSIGIAATYAAMYLKGMRANIVLSAMPVILFAVGSAYPIHFLVAYGQRARESKDGPTALSDAMVTVGPRVLAAGLTTVAGLCSFMVMDIGPLREFGGFCAFGIFVSLVLSLTFVPACISLVNPTWSPGATSAFSAACRRLVDFVLARRRESIAFVILLSVLGAASAYRVEARMDNAAFFDDDSPPAVAENFLQTKFGGSQFIQIEMKGDFTKPEVLRELDRVATVLALRTDVAHVNHIGSVVELVYDSLVGERRLPPTKAVVDMIYRFLAGRPALRQLVTDDHDHALLHVLLADTDARRNAKTLGEIETWLSDYRQTNFKVVTAREGGRPAAPVVQMVADRVALRLKQGGVLPTKESRQKLLAAIANAEPMPVSSELLRTRWLAFLGSDESILEAEHKSLVEPLAAVLAQEIDPLSEEQLSHLLRTFMLSHVAVQTLGDGGLPLPPTNLALLELTVEERDGLTEDLVLSLAEPQREIQRQERARSWASDLLGSLSVVTQKGTESELVRQVGDSLLDLENRTRWLLLDPDGDQSLSLRITGTPSLYRGLSKSVTRNQWLSLGGALGLVFVIMLMWLRSLTAAVLSIAPTVVTLLVVYGTMGIADFSLDIGTSMLASIIIGAGVDYAVHFMSAFRRTEGDDDTAPASRAAAESGASILANALMVGAGFFVLTLGEARPLRNVGLLTSAAMVVSAVATFVTISAFARRSQYRA